MNSARNSRVSDCLVVDVTGHAGRDAAPVAMASRANCPFDIKRVYYLFDVPAGAVRGGHAHHALRQLVIAARGTCDVLLDDGRERRVVTLDTPTRGLYLVPGIWRELFNFSAGSICLVMASAVFEEADYLREYDEFVAFKAWATRR